jgi:hypothetical protein
MLMEENLEIFSKSCKGIMKTADVAGTHLNAVSFE